MTKKRGISIDIVYTKELGNFIKNMNSNIKRNIKTVNNQVRVLQKYFLKYEEPYSEISQNYKAFFLKVDLPMTKKKDIALRILGDKVEIEGISRHRKRRKGFYRSVDIPTNALTGKARAVFRNEKLFVKIPLGKSLSNQV